MRRSLGNKVKMTKEQFRKIRQDMGMTQIEFARLLGFASRAATISDKESGTQQITKQDEIIINLTLEKGKLLKENKKLEKIIEDTIKE